MHFKITFDAPTQYDALGIAAFLRQHRAVEELEMVELTDRPFPGCIQFCATTITREGRVTVVAESDPAKNHYSLVVIHPDRRAQPVESFPVGEYRLPLYDARTAALHRAAVLSIELGYPIKAV